MPHDPTKLTKKESRFVIEYVSSCKRYDAFEKAGFKAKNKMVMAAAVSRLLKVPKIKEAIAELEDAVSKSAMVTPERIIANLAAIAFDKDEVQTAADRIRASDLLGKYHHLWSEKAGGGLQDVKIYLDMGDGGKEETGDKEPV